MQEIKYVCSITIDSLYAIFVQYIFSDHWYCMWSIPVHWLHYLCSKHDFWWYFVYFCTVHLESQEWLLLFSVCFIVIISSPWNIEPNNYVFGISTMQDDTITAQPIIYWRIMHGRECHRFHRNMHIKINANFIYLNIFLVKSTTLHANGI